ncbi:cation:proton antiporter [Entomobacter blattae]|uniref:Na(+)/H(+) antiporter NhaP n=1 Tax=Entomobacter blattae TaxID=2762277 RepID=A0A7H1NSD0_9PROT|nr:sodium:proton antiporter [Entomobacter blattae]QNT78690.1 Na(+)/H(+) antiporter NhaP [Entomobacter blattae]
MPHLLILTTFTLLLSVICGLINKYTLKMPTHMGILAIALMGSLLGAIINFFFNNPFQSAALFLLQEVDFSTTLLKGVLAILLFAGSLHVNVEELWKNRLSIGMLALVGTCIAVALIGSCFWLIFPLFQLNIPYIWCLVLGSILAPTDPVSVIGMLKRIGLPEKLQAIFAGESLFNDGVAIVFFTVTYLIATEASHFTPSIESIGLLLLKDIPGSIFLGFISGLITTHVIRKAADKDMEILLSLTLATGVFSLAEYLECSGPIAVVTAGLMLGHNSAHHKKHNDRSHNFMLTFWEILDEVINCMLFMLIGIEVLAIPFNSTVFFISLLGILIVLASRALSVILSGWVLIKADPKPLSMFSILTWGGLRGGISLALSFTLPTTGPREPFLGITYTIVIFTILVQGLTMEKVSRYFYKDYLMKKENAH